MENLPALRGRTLPAPPSAFFALRRHVRAVAPSLLTDLGPLEAWQVLGWIAVLVVSLGLGLIAIEIVMRLAICVVGTVNAAADRRSFRFAVWARSASRSTTC